MSQEPRFNDFDCVTPLDFRTKAATTTSAWALILFDEYGIPDEEQEFGWRRPGLKEVRDALVDHKGPLHDESFRFANDLKLLCILAPTAYVYAYWLFHNPHLMYLSNIPHDWPNHVGPMLRNEFLRGFYRGEGRPQFRDEFEILYPDSGRRGKPKRGWWGDDIYRSTDREDREGFEETLRRPLLELMGSLDKAEIDWDPSIADPAPRTRVYVEKLLQDPLGDVSQVKNRKQVNSLLKQTLQHFMQPKVTFGMNPARLYWRRLASRKRYSDCLEQANLIDWILREGVYLNAGADVVPAVRAGYDLRSSRASNLRKLPPPKLVQRKKEQLLDFCGNYWPFSLPKAKPLKSLSSHLSGLSFDSIFERIRGGEAKNLYNEYAEALAEADDLKDPEEAARRQMQAIELLLGHIGDILAKKTLDPIFTSDLRLKFARWVIDRRGLIFPALGAATGAAAHFIVPAPIAYIVNVTTGPLGHLLSQQRAVDRGLKRLWGRIMVKVLGDANP